MIPTFVKSYEASAEVDGNLIVAFSDVAASSQVAAASANTDPIIGVSDGLGADLGGMLDVHRGGTVSVRLGGTVAAGAHITSDASGLGIAAVAASGTTVRTIGFADEPGVSGDIIDVFFAPGIIHEA